MTWIIRLLLFVAAPIAALFVSRDALNFGVIETLVAIMLVALALLAGAMWTLRRRPTT